MKAAIITVEALASPARALQFTNKAKEKISQDPLSNIY